MVLKTFSGPLICLRKDVAVKFMFQPVDCFFGFFGSPYFYGTNNEVHCDHIAYAAKYELCS
jgi:hypothetical protein